MDSWQVEQGITTAWTLTLRDSDGVALVDTYDGSEPLAMKLWVGDDQAPETLASSAAEWLAADEGTVTLALDGADLAALDPAIYRLELHLTTGGATYLAFAAMVDLRPGPGAAEPLPTYCTFARMRDLFPPVAQLVTADPSLKSDLADQRAEARRWLDRQLLSRARRDLEWRAAGGRPLPGEAALAPEDWTGTATAVEARLAEIRGFLDADALDTSDPTVALACAYHALSLACAWQIGSKEGEATTWQQIGAGFSRRATSLLLGATLTVVPDAEDDTLTFRLRP